VENQMVSDSEKAARWWKPLLFAALAGGMGWGIRGQYGHETGAMIAGVLVSLTLVFLLSRQWRCCSTSGSSWRLFPSRPSWADAGGHT